jgi:two-component system, OmpR family, sensor histidine kinase TctE
VSYMVSSPPGRFVLGNATLPAPPAGVGAGLQQNGQVLLYRATVDGAENEAARPLRVAVMELNYGSDAAPANAPIA